jgi:hypothetical protein
MREEGVGELGGPRDKDSMVVWLASFKLSRKRQVFAWGVPNHQKIIYGEIK